ncbi:hypothetical protein SDC9_130626 [bioreactor metagenome]|uniref:Uncharacterized protein n=1 Tax=bioreactor metagenome TaxID=1076179 RepID=A0A645D4J2_9ZZZZ
MLVHNGGAHNGNDKLTVHPSYLYDKNGNAIPIYTTAKPNNIFNSTIWGPNIIGTQQKDAQLPVIPVSFDWKDYQDDQNTLSEALNSSADLSGNYYISKNFSQNTGTIRALNGNHVRIYAKDDINVYGNLITDKQTNIIIIAGRNVRIDTQGTIKGNIQIFAEKDIVINRSMQGSVLCMSKGDTIINVGHLRYAYIVSYGDMTVYGNYSKTNPVTLIEGAIMAGQKLEVNGPTLIFYPEIISKWGTWPPDITYP